MEGKTFLKNQAFPFLQKTSEIFLSYEAGDQHFLCGPKKACVNLHYFTFHIILYILFLSILGLFPPETGTVPYAQKCLLNQ